MKRIGVLSIFVLIFVVILISGCTNCENSCPEGKFRCVGNGFQICKMNSETGCSEWSNITPCPTGTTCSDVLETCVADSKQPTCTPNCIGKECGDDGCGGTCGSCTSGYTCVNGLCKSTSVSPVCGNGVCESGESITSCPTDCGSTQPTCTNVCNSGDRKCVGNGYILCVKGSDGCYEWSTTVTPCGTGQTCENGLCIEQQITNPVCGDGSCNGQETCLTCPQDCGKCPCTPKTCSNFTGRCGTLDDGCGGTITCTCPSGQTCENGSCIEQQITNPVCGDGSCNGQETCLTCPQDCGKCPVTCTDTCASLGYTCGTFNICGVSTSCGPNSKSCKKTFGTCSVTGKQICVNGTYGPCTARDPRIANCAGKSCGSDGCGGSCGTCASGYKCGTNGQCCKDECSPYYIPPCYDLYTKGSCEKGSDGCFHIKYAVPCGRGNKCYEGHCYVATQSINSSNLRENIGFYNPSKRILKGTIGIREPASGVFNLKDGITFEVSVGTVNATDAGYKDRYCIWVRDNSRGKGAKIFINTPSLVNDNSACGKKIKLPTNFHSSPHTFRIAVKGTKSYCYIDGKLVAEGSPQNVFLPTGATLRGTPCSVGITTMFGLYSFADYNGVKVNSIYYRNDGAFSPDGTQLTGAITSRESEMVPIDANFGNIGLGVQIVAVIIILAGIMIFIAKKIFVS